MNESSHRTRQRILAAAASSLDDSTELSLNAVAKQAGVGVGTVYRQFPTPEALVLAVYELEMHQLVEVVPDLLATHTPPEAFRRWVVDHLAHYFTVKRGLVAALRASLSGNRTRDAAFAAVTAAVASLLQANLDAGTIRDDIDPAVVVRALSGLLIDFDRDRTGDGALLVDLLWRGMHT